MFKVFTNDIALLNIMFEKKKFGREPLTEKEAKLLGRVQFSKLLKRILDPQVSFRFTEMEDSVPTKLELELGVLAVTGRPMAENGTIAQAFNIIGRALEYAADAEDLYSGKVVSL